MSNTAIHIYNELSKDYSVRVQFGARCRFYNLGGGIGVKTYSYRTKGFQTYHLQKVAHGFGIGPDCWGLSYDNYHVSYFTEVVPVLSDNGFFEFTHAERYEILRDAQKSLSQSIPGFRIEDLHEDNVAMLPDGTWKCIDFDHCFLRY